MKKTFSQKQNKTKKNSKTQLDERNLHFHGALDHFVFLYIPNACFRRRLPYMKRCTAWKVSKYGVFLVRIFPHSDWIRRDTSYCSVFSPNTGKYGPEKTPYLDPFHAVMIVVKNFKTAERLILDQWKITYLCCSFSILLGPLARKCCIVICFLTANTIIVAQRCI